VAEACARYGVSRAGFARARREGVPAWTADEIVLVALVHHDGRATVATILAYVDWLDHAVLTAAEAGERLARLESGGFVRRDGEAWILATDWP
jgi:hypothetical protein